jgi:hypothetical protein
MTEEYCGCCGDPYPSCWCPDGPTDLFREVKRRWAKPACVRCYESQLPPEMSYPVDEWELP